MLPFSGSKIGTDDIGQGRAARLHDVNEEEFFSVRQSHRKCMYLKGLECIRVAILVLPGDAPHTTSGGDNRYQAFAPDFQMTGANLGNKLQGRGNCGE